MSRTIGARSDDRRPSTAAGSTAAALAAPFMRTPFQVHPWLKSGHLQTVGAVYLPGQRFPYSARQHRVDVCSGDQVVLHDDCPAAWRAGDRAVFLIHGLAGCHQSHYMVRIAARLHARQVRVFRMDLRACGAGWNLARKSFHSACTDDVAAALRVAARLCPGSPIALAGFSLGGNLTLKLLAEFADDLPAPIDRACATSPPVDLLACSENLQRGYNRIYDRHFARTMRKRMVQRVQALEGVYQGTFAAPPRTMREIDAGLTAPLWNFSGVDNYYRVASPADDLRKIRIPTILVAADDDPLIPVRIYHELQTPPEVHLHITRGGGHLGFVGRRGVDPDTRWLDWRIIEWATL